MISLLIVFFALVKSVIYLPIGILALIIFAIVHKSHKRGTWWLYFTIIALTTLAALCCGPIFLSDPKGPGISEEGIVYMTNLLTILFLGPIVGMVLGLFALLQTSPIRDYDDNDYLDDDDEYEEPRRTKRERMKLGANVFLTGIVGLVTIRIFGFGNFLLVHACVVCLPLGIFLMLWRLAFSR